jgi:hypothetical protein
MLKRLAGATVIVVLLLTVLEASAVEDEVNRLANNFSHENLICAVYNSLVAQCIENATQMIRWPQATVRTR